MNRFHILVLGACNSGKSALVNMLTGQATSLVAPKPGTTTDPVRRAMEIAGLGPCMVIDTAGFDDTTALGSERVGLTRRALDEADAALLLVGENPAEEERWAQELKARAIATIRVANKADLRAAQAGAIAVNAITGYGRERLIEALQQAMPSEAAPGALLGGLAGAGDVVVLVMPQDGSAPKDRLILPQVETIRALLDIGAIPVGCTPATLPSTLAALSAPPRLIITDSQAFKAVAPHIPEGVTLTSFSVLQAAKKGDIAYFAESAAKIDRLTPGSRVLIAEGCSHAPQSEDIGRVKIPALLRRRVGEGLRIDHAAGRDFPADLSPYDLIIHCGGCMLNRSMVMARVRRAKAASVAMTNYGIAIAHLSGLLPRVTLPG